MQIPISMVILSHLSDIPHEQDSRQIHMRCEFVKFLILKFGDIFDDAKIDIDPDQAYISFQEQSKLFTKATLRTDLAIPTKEGDYLQVEPGETVVVTGQPDHLDGEEFNTTILYKKKYYTVNSIDLKFGEHD